MDKVHIVIFGGDSYEHEISIISAVQAMKQLKDCKAVYIALDGTWYEGDNLKELESYKNSAFKKNKQITILPNSKYLYLKKGKKLKAYYEIEDVLCVFHGNLMEGGGMSSLFELNHIPYSCSPTLGSAIVQSKAKAEYCLSGMGIDRLPYVVANKQTFGKEKEHILSKIKEQLSYPVILKPSNLGSSIGIAVVHEENELDSALQTAFGFDEEVLIQGYLSNMKEVNIALYEYQGGLHCSKIEEPLKQEEILSFADKYQKGEKEGMSGLSRILDPILKDGQKEEIEHIAKSVYQTLSLSGVVRFDFMIDMDTDHLYLNEINNIPGSLAFYLFGLSYDELIRRLLVEAHKKNAQVKKKEISFCVLNTLSSSKLGKLHK